MASPAARLGDSTVHLGRIAGSALTVRIGGRFAARKTDDHTCPMTGHVGGPITGGSSNVRIEGLEAARVGDPAQCTGAPTAIQGLHVLGRDDHWSRPSYPTGAGDFISSGERTVRIGADDPVGSAVERMEADAARLEAAAREQLNEGSRQFDDTVGMPNAAQNGDPGAIGRWVAEDALEGEDNQAGQAVGAALQQGRYGAVADSLNQRAAQLRSQADSLRRAR